MAPLAEQVRAEEGQTAEVVYIRGKEIHSWEQFRVNDMDGAKLRLRIFDLEKVRHGDFEIGEPFCYGTSEDDEALWAYPAICAAPDWMVRKGGGNYLGVRGLDRPTLEFYHTLYPERALAEAVTERTLEKLPDLLAVHDIIAGIKSELRDCIKDMATDSGGRFAGLIKNLRKAEANIVSDTEKSAAAAQAVREALDSYLIERSLVEFARSFPKAA